MNPLGIAAIAAVAMFAAGYSLAASLLAVSVILAYVVECRFWPFGPCMGCSGGKRSSPFSKGYRRHKRCKGRGERVRVGRRVWDWWTASWAGKN
jgi:hypothetical protein